jgi:hypothetical protein
MSIPKIFANIRTGLVKLQAINNFTFTGVSIFQIQMMDQIIKSLELKKAYSYGGYVYLKIDSDVKSPFGFTSKQLDKLPNVISLGKLDQKEIMIWTAENFYDLSLRGDGRSEFYFRNLVSGITG